jgi:hypothetical protein
MGVIRCEFCHRWVFEKAYPAHRAKHVKPRADGRPTDSATLPPRERARGPLANVPHVYEHPRCGSRTGVPEETIRSYLEDPFLYSGNTTFCAGCKKQVPFREVSWVETGEDLQSYMKRLRCAAVGNQLVRVTPKAAEAFRALATLRGMDGTGFLAIDAREANGQVVFNLNLAPAWDRQKELNIESGGIHILIKKDQADRVAGTKIDYSGTGARGFVIISPHG